MLEACWATLRPFWWILLSFGMVLFTAPLLDVGFGLCTVEGLWFGDHVQLPVLGLRFKKEHELKADEMDA